MTLKKNLNRCQIVIFLPLKKNAFLDDVLNCTNNYKKLIKIFSFIFRFQRNSREPNRRSVGELSLKCRDAELKVIQLVQNVEFLSDIMSLKRIRKVNPRSKLKSLDQFLDSKGILGVGSRIAYSGLSYNSQ